MTNNMGGTASSSIIVLAVGIGMMIMTLVIIGVVGGSIYNVSEPNILGTGWNTVINETLNDSTGDYDSGVSVELDHNPVIINSYTTIYDTNSSAEVVTHHFTINNWLGNLTLNNASLANHVFTMDYHYGNTTIENAIKGGIQGSFEGLETIGNYSPLIVLAIIVGLILTLVIGMTGSSGFGTRSTGGVL